ncbi:MAG: competence protein [Prolixibacteraceae bacterium]|nr:MAG: competence protein [Prolixibacteraceae bacterium]
MEKTFQNIPFLRITVAFAAGIVTGVNYTVNETLGFAILTAILILLVVISKKYKFDYSLYFGTGVQLFFIWLGILVAQQHNEKPQFYDRGNFIATVLETPQEKPNSWKSVIQIEAVHYSGTVKQTNELVIVYFAKNGKVAKLKSGDIILFSSVPQLITNNNNPYVFDYKKYLEQKRIYRQVYLTEENWTKTNKTKFSIVCQAERIRESLLKIYRSQPIDETEFEILSALTLGYSRELDPETRRVFSSSGAIHVLSVSGQHVAIVFWVITLLFGSIRTSKLGRIIFMTITIAILWFYALITGLSPSAMRASSMFTIFIISENLQRKSNIYNSLAASAFLLLLINPNNLYDIGFQLSYVAVFGIVFLQPKMEGLIFVKSKFFRFFWSLITVSIAAQIATFPITTYYFGQFPTYFWIANTFVIPAVMVLLPIGISLLFISKIYFLSNLLAVLLNYMIKITYFLLSSVELLPFSVLEIHINQIQFIFLVAIVISGIIYLIRIHVYLIKTTLFFTLLLSVSVLLAEINRLNHRELIVYDVPKNPTIHLIHGKRNYIISEEKIKEDEMHYFPGITTARKLGLNHPVFLISSDTFTNGEILLKTGYVFFEGKTIMVRKNLTSGNKTKPPDFIINPANTENPEYLNSPQTIIISDNRFMDKNHLKTAKVHFINLHGAFRKKW